MNSSKFGSIFLSKKSLLIVILFMVAVVVALELTNTTYLFHKKKVPQTIPAKIQKISDQKKNESASGKKNSGSSSSETTNSSDKVASPSGGNASGATLVEPYGSFVSNHFPGQNGSNTKEQSVCNTTPGATCYIQFTNTSTGKVTKLPSQVVNSDNSAIWSWDANTLTSGKWQVTAIANLNGQTKSASDSIKLEIP